MSKLTWEEWEKRNKKSYSGFRNYYSSDYSSAYANAYHYGNDRDYDDWNPEFDCIWRGVMTDDR